MKMQAHLPAVSIGARDWHVPMIGLVSLFGAAILVVTLQSGVLLGNPLVEQFGSSADARPRINLLNVGRGVSLDLHSAEHPSGLLDGFSVAHTLPAKVAWEQRFSIGAEERSAFEVFGDAALRGMLADESTRRQLKPRHDRLLLMLMLLHLRTQRRG